MADPTEQARRDRIIEINIVPGSRADLEQKHGKIWATDEICEDFSVIGFMAPFVIVRRKSDGVKGSLEFQHSPRFYYSFQPH